MNARLLKCDQIADGTISFMIEVEQPFAFKAGQSCDLTLIDPRYTDDKGSTRTFSIASAPAEAPRLIFATRQTGSAFKRSIQDAAAGLKIEVDGPWGGFVLHGDPARPAVFMAGGIGITPFRSIIKDAVERRLGHTITLLYSNRNALSAPFLNDLESWSHVKRGFRFIPTLTNAQVNGWTGRRGPIDAGLIAEQRQNGVAPMYYAAGPAAFVTAMQHALFEAHVRAGDIQTDEFPGY